jgi:hypothetical protein
VQDRPTTTRRRATIIKIAWQCSIKYTPRVSAP